MIPIFRYAFVESQGQGFGMIDKMPKLNRDTLKKTLVTARVYTWQIQLIVSHIKRFSSKRLFSRRPASDEKSSTSMKTNDPASLKKKFVQATLPSTRAMPFLQIDLLFTFLFFFLHTSCENKYLHRKMKIHPNIDFTLPYLWQICAKDLLPFRAIFFWLKKFIFQEDNVKFCRCFSSLQSVERKITIVLTNYARI